MFKLLVILCIIKLHAQINIFKNNFASLIVKMILLELALLSAPAADKMHSFVHLRFNSSLQLINGISSDL